MLTFDDSTAGQFRYLVGEDGALTIDPDSAVGVMEAFYAAHPDFGRGGFFAVLPQGNFCFAWQGEEREDGPDSTSAQQKLTWLLDNGYEVGNHTLNHSDLYDVDDDTFRAEIGGRDRGAAGSMTRGRPPTSWRCRSATTRTRTRQQHQRTWLRDGFTYDGNDYQILGCLMVGRTRPTPRSARSGTRSTSPGSRPSTRTPRSRTATATRQ